MITEVGVTFVGYKWRFLESLLESRVRGQNMEMFENDVFYREVVGMVGEYQNRTVFCSAMFFGDESCFSRNSGGTIQSTLTCTVWI